MINVNLKLSIVQTIHEIMKNHFMKQNGGSSVFNESQQEVVDSIDKNVDEFFDSPECIQTSFSGELIKKLMLMVSVQGTMQNKKTGEVTEIDNDELDAVIRSYQIDNTIVNHIKLIVLMRLINEQESETVSRIKLTMAKDLHATLDHMGTSVDEDILKLLTEEGNTIKALMAEYGVVFGDDYFDLMVELYGGDPLAALSVFSEGNQNIASQELILYSMLMFKIAGDEAKPMAHLAVTTAAEQLVASTLSTVLNKYYTDVLGEEFIKFLVSPVPKKEVH